MDDPETQEHNLRIYDEYVTTFHNHGMKAGCWYTAGGDIYKAPGSSDLAIAEIEGPGDYEGVRNVIQGVGGGPLPSCPLATVTNFSTMTRDMAKVLIDAGFTCMPEAYLNEHESHTPDNEDFQARQLGWPTSQPVAGVYPVNGQPPPSYAKWDDWPLADYLGEYVI